MEHNKYLLHTRFPIIGKIVAIVMAVIAIVAAFEWNRVTDTYWGFLFLAIALPGLFYPLLKILQKLFKDNSRRN